MREELITMSTIKEIAQRAGVSAAAVSRILNYDPTLKVAEQTRQRVFDEAKKLGYVKRKIKTKNKNAVIILFISFIYNKYQISYSPNAKYSYTEYSSTLL